MQLAASGFFSPLLPLYVDGDDMLVVKGNQNYSAIAESRKDDTNRAQATDV